MSTPPIASTANAYLPPFSFQAIMSLLIPREKRKMKKVKKEKKKKE
ncbi:TPA: hypothetical protein HA361_01635 [Candidatus Woesearchaeota archaeon]|nr:hypothetical protein [Candidatus Woesearchaeota archaeon]